MSVPVVRIAVLTTPPSLKIKLLPKPVVQVRALVQIPAQLAVDSVTTGEPGTDASVVNVGTPGNARLQFTIPRGAQGLQGETGPQGIQGETGPAGSDSTVPGPAGADGVVQSLVAGSNITIDATDPANPVINSSASGSGDVVGPAGAVDSAPAVFDGTTGKLIKGTTYAAFKTLLSLVKGDVGLGNVDNTSDATKNSAAATLTNKTLTSPVINGATGSAASSFTATTQSARDNSTKLATTAYVDAAAREKLTANRTYYVRTDGSDTNNGLSNTSGGAFLTIQKAVNTVAALDLSVYNVTIQVGAGTYTGAVLVNGPWVGLGSVSLIGDTTTPTNVVISTTSADCITSQNNGVLNVGGFKLTTTTSGSCLTATANGTIYISGAINFGSTPTNSPQISAANGGKVFNLGGGNITISGGSFAHVYAQQLGGIVYASITVTVTGTPAFSYAFAAANNVGFFRSASATYSGAATGSRYNSSAGSVIQTDGGGTSLFPGNATGTAVTGQYL